MNEAQRQHMISRFLSWKMPENFSPDAGISFKASYNENTRYPSKHEPTGTNLFNRTQAEAMVRYTIARPEVTMNDSLVNRLLELANDDALRDYLTQSFHEAATVITSHEARERELEEALTDTTAHLAATISLLKRGGKKAAASDKMFKQMLVDYENSLARGRAALDREAFELFTDACDSMFDIDRRNSD